MFFKCYIFHWAPTLNSPVTIFRLVQEGYFNMNSVVVRSGMSVGKSLLLLIQTLMLPINFHIHVFWIKEMGKYAGSMRSRALSGAETIHVNGEVLEYLIQGNQHGYCAVHTPLCRTYGTMPYAVCRMKYAVREHASSLLSQAPRPHKWREHVLFLFLFFFFFLPSGWNLECKVGLTLNCVRGVPWYPTFGFSALSF